MKSFLIATAIVGILLMTLGAVAWGIYTKYQKYEYRKAVIELARRGVALPTPPNQQNP